MAIAVAPASRPDEWMTALGDCMPHEDLRLWPDVGDRSEIEYLIAWRMRRADLATLENLELVLCMGAGTEQWQLPGIELPVVRLADPEMANQMAAYCVAWVARHARRFAELEQNQAERRWEVLEHDQPWDFPVGVLGYGEIGSRIAQVFGDLGYAVNAWSRTGRDHDGAVRHFAGAPELHDFLGASSAVINVLPSTPATTALLDRDSLGQVRPGSVFVNIGRGTVLASEDDLIAALDDGPLGAAVLDVTHPEPPSPDSALWTHPAVTLTPHVSGMTPVRSAARIIAANVARLRAGESPFPLLDRRRGY